MFPELQGLFQQPHCPLLPITTTVPICLFAGPCLPGNCIDIFEGVGCRFGTIGILSRLLMAHTLGGARFGTSIQVPSLEQMWNLGCLAANLEELCV